MKTFTKFLVASVAVAALAFAVTAKADTVSFGTMTLKQGSTGTFVMNLQTALNATGANPALVADGSFGLKTKNAVMAFQASHGLTADGVVGPMTKAAITAALGGANSGNFPAGCTSASGFSTTTGQPCTALPSTMPAGCAAGFMFSPVNGQPCTSTGSTGSNNNGPLSGGAGSVETYELLSGISNEDVGEGDEDVEVAGLEIEADEGSDLKLTAVKLVFDEGTAGSDFEDYAEEVTLWLDGTKIATVDADEFNDDNDWTQTISLTSNAVIDAGETAELTVAVTAVENLDTADENDTWTVDFRSIRFVDAQGASTTEDPGTATRTFTFTSFASANDIEMSVSLSDDSPEGNVVDVDATDDTDGVELLVFEIEAEGSDITIDDLPVLLTVSQPTVTDDVDFIVNTLTLTVDGESYSETVTTSAGSVATITFDDLDITIEDGDTLEFTVTADVNDTQASEFIAGDTLKVELTEAIVNNIEAEDETGEDITDADATGTALGDAMAFYESGISVELVSVEEELTGNDGADNDTGSFTIKYKVTAFDDTVYVSDTAAATTATDSAITTATSIVSNLYRVEENGTATTADLSALVTYSNTSSAPQSSGGNITLEDGESTTVTLSISRTNNGDANDDGIYQAFLAAIGWNTGDSSSVYNNYYFNLDDYKTDPITIN